MALPTIRPYWMNTYKTPIELSHRRLERQADLQSCWNKSQKFFKDGEIHARKSNCWTSDVSVKRSMDAVDKLLCGLHETEKKTSIEVRRSKLLKLITTENKKYQEEMHDLRSSGDKSLSAMQHRVEKLRTGKEEGRKKDADQKLHEHWRQNEPRLREIESERRNAHAVKSWRGQVDEKEVAALTEREEKKRYEGEMEEKRREALALERQRIEEHKQQMKQNATDLKQQIAELKKRDEDAERLRNEDEKLIEHEKMLLEAEEKRKLVEEQRKKHELGRVLIRQYKHQLKRKSQEVQKALRNDLQLLQEIAEKEEEEMEIRTARKEKEKSDAEYMLKVVADQLQLEKCREADLDALYQEEASRQWQKRESEWERERLARERLMKAVLDERQEQIKEKREILHRQQEDSIKEREILLEEMEEYEQLTHREEEEKLTARKQRDQEIKEQIGDIVSQREKSKREEMEELENERLKEEDYEEKISREAERLNLIEETPPTYRRKKVAFM